ncbi:unnamed protein product [Rotaria sp. Silwood1]|nr:unnamed protein product [Rotaria sp. Silwood1]
MNSLLIFVLLKFLLSTSQINLYYTDWFSGSESNRINREMLTCCMSEWTTKYHIEMNNLFQKLTFGELAKRNITNHELYSWSTPIDIQERYQLYLNQI